MNGMGMNNSYFINENRLHKWIKAAEGIKEEFGTKKAFGYLIGEKFYNIVSDKHFARRMVVSINEQMKQPDYNTVRESRGRFSTGINLDKERKGYEQIVAATENILVEFANLIKKAFTQYEIKGYFDSNPRLGILAHTVTEDMYDMLIQQGVVEHSLEKETEEALILGDMMKYFHLTV